MFFHGQESHPDRVLARCWQSKAERFTLARKKLVRDLDQDSGPVAGFRIAAACAAMRQVDKDLNSLLDNFVTFFAANAGDKPNAAGIMLVRRVVETLCWRQAIICVPVLQDHLSKPSFVVGRSFAFDALFLRLLDAQTGWKTFSGRGCDLDWRMADEEQPFLARASTCVSLWYSG
jgi:hypothetical protein